MRRKIKYIELADGTSYTPAVKDDFYGCGRFYECKIKHLGSGRYLIRYFDPYKNGTYHSNALKNPINTLMIVFPNEINRVVFK